MDALGMIETKGLIAAIEACDVMLKTANVSLVGKRKSTATLVTILITGDVGAVKASVEAGAAAAEKVTPGSLLSAHVIPRPIGDIEKAFGPGDTPKKPSGSGEKTVDEVAFDSENVAETAPTADAGSEDLHSAESIEVIEDVAVVEEPVKVKTAAIATDAVSLDDAAQLSAENLQKMSVSELRKLARRQPNLGISGRKISSANKQVLINYLEASYKH